MTQSTPRAVSPLVAQRVLDKHGITGMRQELTDDVPSHRLGGSQAAACLAARVLTRCALGVL